MWRWLTFFLFFSMAQYSFAQHSGSEARWSALGSQLMKHGNYHGAFKIFHHLDTLHPGNPSYSYALGVCTFRAADKPSSLHYFLKAKRLGFQSYSFLLDIAKAYYFNNDIENTLRYLREYEQNIAQSANEKERSELIQFKNQINSSKSILERKLSVEVTNMGAQVNSPQADYVPMVVGDGKQLVFTSRRHKSTGGKIALDGHHYEDIYVTHKDSTGKWKEAVHLDGFNSSKHDANVALNQDGSVLLIYKAKHNGDIFISSRKENGDWSSLKPLMGINTLYWEGSACLSFDERTLFFSSDRPGGFGGSDLYCATLSADGNWSQIRNLGPDINTPFDEDAPFLYKDGTTLFFSSKGHNSLGGYDIFSSHLSPEAQWTEVKNMGFPINTFDDDIYFHLNADGAVGYFTSFRHSNFKEKSIGEKDIFQISRPHTSPALFVLKGKITDKATGTPITAIVTVKDLAQNGQQQVADISTGIFKFELQFENNYHLSVEVAGKIYDSGQLFFPFRADLFEYFLPITLDSIPTFDLQLADVMLKGDKQVDIKPTVLKKEQRAIVLVRKIAFDEPDMRKLMNSDNIPFSVRVKIAQQQKDSTFLDLHNEGNLKPDLLSSLLDSSFMTAPMKMELPSNTKSETIDPVSAKQSNDYAIVKKEIATAPVYGELSVQEQQMIMRWANQIVDPDTAFQIGTFDLLYYENLYAKEKSKIKGEIMIQADRKAPTTLDGQKQRFLSLQRLTESTKMNALAKGKLAFYDKASWEILHTIETAGFKNDQHLEFKSTLIKRNNASVVPNEKLIVIEDDGLVFAELVTDEKGEFRIPDLMIGNRYHILVDDYTIALTGLSRYQLLGSSLAPKDEEYMIFYNQLSSEAKRRVDRIASALFLKRAYEEDSLRLEEDPLSWEQMSSSEQTIVSSLKNYMNAEHSGDEHFTIDLRHSERYEQLDFVTREKYDRLLSRQALVNSHGDLQLYANDSLFYDSLTELEKRYVADISKARANRRHIMGTWANSNADSQYWYEMGGVNTTKEKTSKVKITGNITSSTQPISDGALSVVLMDSNGRMTSVVDVDSTGRFYFYAIDTNKEYKVLMSKPSSGVAADYDLSNVTIMRDNRGLYDSLSHTERRRIDRIIARNLAHSAYKESPALSQRDREAFLQLTAEEKKFIKRLQQHLYTDTVNLENSQLDREDHHTYYATLSPQKRSFINRYIIQSFNDTLAVDRIMLSAQDSMIYLNISKVDKLQIDQMQTQRAKAIDIFAENPILIGVKRRVLLDSLVPVKGTHYHVRGRLVDKFSKMGIHDVPVYLSDQNGNIITMASTDGEGYFEMKDQFMEEKFFAMAENDHNHFFSPLDFQVQFFRMDLVESQLKMSHAKQVDSVFELHFAYNEARLNQVDRSKLLHWMEKIEKGEAYFITVSGHTDTTGKNDYNQSLSERRASTVSRFLNERGIRTQRVLGYGKTQIKYQRNDLNRRVEVTASFEEDED